MPRDDSLPLVDSRFSVDHAIVGMHRRIYKPFTFNYSNASNELLELFESIADA
jgi:hypothetical protein